MIVEIKKAKNLFAACEYTWKLSSVHVADFETVTPIRIRHTPHTYVTRFYGLLTGILPFLLQVAGTFQAIELYK